MLQLQILSPKRFAREFLVGFAQIGGQFIVLCINLPDELFDDFIVIVSLAPPSYRCR